MNEFNFTHCFFILHPALPFNVAEPHIAVASCETSVVSQLIEGGVIYKPYYYSIYICIPAISRRKKKAIQTFLE
jgi:hypothetical protein